MIMQCAYDPEVDCQSNVTSVYHNAVEEYTTWCKESDVRDYLKICSNSNSSFPWVSPSIIRAITGRRPFRTVFAPPEDYTHEAWSRRRHVYERVGPRDVLYLSTVLLTQCHVQLENNIVQLHGSISKFLNAEKSKFPR